MCPATIHNVKLPPNIAVSSQSLLFCLSRVRSVLLDKLTATLTWAGLDLIRFIVCVLLGGWKGSFTMVSLVCAITLKALLSLQIDR